MVPLKDFLKLMENQKQEPPQRDNGNTVHGRHRKLSASSSSTNGADKSIALKDRDSAELNRRAALDLVSLFHTQGRFSDDEKAILIADILSDGGSVVEAYTDMNPESLRKRILEGEWNAYFENVADQNNASFPKELRDFEDRCHIIAQEILQQSQ